MALYQQDFEAAPVGLGIPTGFTRRWATPSATAEKVADTGTPSLGLAFRLQPTGAGRYFYSFDALNADAGRAACNVLATVRTSNVQASVTHIGVVGRGSGAATTETGYTANFIGSVFRLGKYVNGTFTSLGELASFGAASNTVYRVRLDCQGTTIRAKAWIDGSPEPDGYVAPHGITATDSSITAAGWCGPFFFSAPTLDCGAIAVGTSGDIATFDAPGGASGPVVASTSSEAAQALTGKALRPVASAASIESAGALPSRSKQSASAASSSELAAALLARAARPLAAAASSEQASQLVGVARRVVPGATSAEQAMALSGRQLRGVAAATSAEVAYALLPAVPRDFATERNDAFALAGRHLKPLLSAQETSAASALRAVARASVLAATEHTQAAALGSRVRRAIAAATSVERAYALAGSGATPLPVVGPAERNWGASAQRTAFGASAIKTAFSAQEAQGALMKDNLAPGSFHVFSIDWRYGPAPYLRSGESLASVTATVNGSVVSAEVDGDATLWNVQVAADAAPGSKLTHSVSIVTDSDPPRRDTRTIQHYVGAVAATPL